MSRSIPAVLLIFALLITGCTQSFYRQGLAASEEGNHDAALDLYYKAVKEQPDDHLAWREIGMAWFRTGALEKAEEAFATSNRISPNALSNLYLGLIFEDTGQLDRAIRVYSAAANLQGKGKTKEMIEGRLSVLIDQRLTNEAKLAVLEEDSLDVDSLPKNSIAVINFDGSNLSSDLQPIALGLAEFVAMDLAKVSSLKVLERMKINVILDELQLSESNYSNTSVGPRVGKLLGSSRIVLGSVNSTGDDGFRVDGKLVNTADGKVSGTRSGEGSLEEFFHVEKQFVFGILDTLGIEITKEERDAIEEVPTESFLAFMSYSKGLFYERRGMHSDAARSFRNAGNADPGFSQASDLAGKMDQASSFGSSGFEADVTTSMKREDSQSGFGTVQAANLINCNFIANTDLYWTLGSLAAPPPGGAPVWYGNGIIIIRGDFDAK
ncbi:MAG: tetratricopeptide repeat protein [Bacteroidales bacterium]|nr:tetratricopeptide repeat protein [Candidatus Latescibacterota bacterium]